LNICVFGAGAGGGHMGALTTYAGPWMPSSHCAVRTVRHAGSDGSWLGSFVAVAAICLAVATVVFLVLKISEWSGRTIVFVCRKAGCSLAEAERIERGVYRSLAALAVLGALYLFMTAK
jgi:hypothetical protein